MDNDNYANYPRSITEIKSEETGLAYDNTPRDVLISVLRKLDAGEINPAILVVAVAEPNLNEKGAFRTVVSVSSKNALMTMGLVTDVLNILANDQE